MIKVELETQAVDIQLSTESIVVEVAGVGMEGLSAFEIWQRYGGVGTEEDFLVSLKGEGSETYIHDQLAPSTEWAIGHNLLRYPSVTVVDSAGSMVMGDVQYIDKNNILIEFAYQFAGKAYLN